MSVPHTTAEWAHAPTAAPTGGHQAPTRLTNRKPADLVALGERR
ncbi:hypothetical protein [Streptomyces sp. NPDC058632]